VSCVWINGDLVPEASARVSPFDHGLLTGDGVFETLLARDGTVFAVRRHLERLARSAVALGLAPPSADVLRAALSEVMEGNGLADARLRITVTGGPSPLGSDRGAGPTTAIVAAGALTVWPPTTAVVLAPWPRNERSALAGVKSTSYAENVVALAWARERDAGEALLANTAGDLCEGTGSNVFVVLDGRLVTPPLTSGCLAGVVRSLLVECGLAGEEDIPVSKLAEVDEAFLTSSTREAQPIDRLDGRPLRPPFRHADDALRLLQGCWKNSPDP
jgi:branched-chain amino acid aminotransferase